MTKIRIRSGRVRALTGVVAAALVLGLAACGSSGGSSTAAASVGPNGTDDGTI